jgi:hypothetical protein
MPVKEVGHWGVYVSETKTVSKTWVERVGWASSDKTSKQKIKKLTQGTQVVYEVQGLGKPPLTGDYSFEIKWYPARVRIDPA